MMNLRQSGAARADHSAEWDTLTERPLMPRGISNGRARECHQAELIPIESLRTGEFALRSDTSVDNESLEQLTHSIAVSGVLQPIVVRKAGKGIYHVLAGERRLAAVRRLKFAKVPCVVARCSRSEGLVIALTENLQRLDLSPIERARGLHRLLQESDLSQSEIASQIGISQSAVAHHLRLLELPSAVQELVQHGELTLGHGKVLAGIKDDHLSLALAKKCIAEGSSVRELEANIARVPDETVRRPGPMKPKRSEVELPNGLFLVIKQSSANKNSGRIEIPYYSSEEMEWVLAILGGNRGFKRPTR